MKAQSAEGMFIPCFDFESVALVNKVHVSRTTNKERGGGIFSIKRKHTYCNFRVVNSGSRQIGNFSLFPNLMNRLKFNLFSKAI